MRQRVFQVGENLAVPLPADLVEQFHLEAGTSVEIEPRDDGLLLKPVESHSLSPAWQLALEHVIERYRPALERLGEND